MTHENYHPAAWPLWQKVLFRFFVIYFVLQVFQRPFFEDVPGFRQLANAQHYICFKAVNFFNNYILHNKGTLTPMALSTDSLFHWVQLTLFFTLAVTGTIVWSIIDRKRRSYNRASYCLVTLLRFYLAYVSFMYGIIKLYGLQMPFPTLTYLATPVGDLLPIKLSWLYIGYSGPYQIFSGLMEFTVGVLLLYRRTVTLGLFIGLGVYANVLMMNLGYDIPVKIFSAHLVLMILYLLARDAKRVANFFIFNRPASQSVLYSPVLSKTGNMFRLAAKCIFLLAVMYLVAGPYGSLKTQLAAEKTELKPIPYGLYDVTLFVKNGDTLPVLANDTLIWKDIIFERGNNYASVNTGDTLFRKIYNRGLFYYKADTLNNTITAFKRTEKRKWPVFKSKYKLAGNNKHVQMWIKLKKDSLYLELDKSNRKFKLAEKPFHWVTKERN